MDVPRTPSDRRRRQHRQVAVLAVLAGLLVVTGCSTAAPDAGGSAAAPAEPSTPPPASRPTSGATSGSPSERTEPSADPSPTPTPTPTPEPDPVSIDGLAARGLDGGDLRLGDVLAEEPGYTRYAVTYRSEGLTVSGVLNVPDGDGPFPAAVLGHGYIDPDVYVTGQGLAREQDYLAREGYVVLHTDYRGHAGSDPDPDIEVDLRLGYAADLMNAVLALRSWDAGPVDGDRIAYLGRSMGGGVTYTALAAQPGLVDAAVVYAPVSSDAAQNFDRWTRDSDDRDADLIAERHGLPEDAPEFWEAVSPRSAFDRITEPVLIQHGTEDESCPLAWSETTAELMADAGVDVELEIWPGEPHAFEAGWEASMERTVTFLDAQLTG